MSICLNHLGNLKILVTGPTPRNSDVVSLQSGLDVRFLKVLPCDCGVPPALGTVGTGRFVAVLTRQDDSAKGSCGAEEKCPFPAALAAGEDAGQPGESGATHGAGLLSPDVQCTT